MTRIDIRYGGRGGPTQPDEAAPPSRPTAHFSTQYRDQQVGSQLTGAEGLVEPGHDQPRLRLSAGRPVPGTRYRLTRWLGEGGMGVVYEAEHMDLERHVAMKILRFDLSQQANMAQVFRDEARAASRIGSKYIVEIYDFGELQDGRLWFCMELLDGHDLVPADDDASMDPGELIGIMRMVCKGLDQAHDAGIVHRDIKPENILVVERDQRRTVKILDFGISAMLAAGSREGAAIAGTPHYMPPEQVLGQPFDGRCDMYALGCMAYELLVGHPPFVAEDLQELLDMQVNENPPPVDKVRTDVRIPPALAAVVMRCLEKDPENRFRDMKDLEAALCEAQVAAGLHTAWDDLPLPEVEENRRAKLLAAMPSPSSAHLPPRRRWLWPAVAGVSALVAGAAIFFATQQKPDENALAQIDELTRQAEAAGARAAWVYPPATDHDADTSYLKVLELEGLEGALDKPGDDRATTLRHDFSATLTELGDTFWTADATRAIARDYYWQAALFDDTNQLAFERSGVTRGFLAQQAEKAAQRAFSSDEILAARQELFLAQAGNGSAIDEQEQQLIFAAGEADDASMIRRQQMRRAAKARGLELPDAPSGGSEGATDGADGGDGGVAEGGEDDELLAAADTTGGEDDELAAVILDEIADDRPSLSKRGSKKKRRRDSGDPDLGKGERDPDKAASLADQGASALSSGRRAEAEKLFNQAISYDNRNAKALMGLSDVYFDTGKAQKAVLYAERAVRAASSNGSYRMKLGDAYYRVLRYQDALEQYEKAKQMGVSKAQSRIDKVKDKIG